MKIRFTLHPQLDADLISHIQLKANGASHNEAAKILVRNWYYAEMVNKTSSKRPTGDSEVTDQELDFSDLDAAFKDM